MPFQNLGVNFMLQRDSSYGKLLIKFTLKNGEILSLKPIADGGYLMYKTKKYALMTTVLISASLLYFGLNAETGGNIEYPDFETYGQTVYLPTYIPEGYTVQSVNIEDEVITVIFVNNLNFISFTQMPSLSLGIDNDSADYSIIKTTIGNKSGYISENNNKIIFIYYDINYAFSISGGLDKDELSKIVSSIKLYAQ